MEEIWSNFVKVLEPHLGTIIGSVITASLSGLFTIFQKRSLRKEVFEHLENIGNQFDKSRYQDEYKDLIKQLKENFDGVEKSIFKAAENVCMDGILGWQKGEEKHSYLDFYDDDNE